MRNPIKIFNQRALPILALAVLTFATAGASAQSDEVLSIDINPQQAGSALVTLAKSSGMQILFAKGAGTQVEIEGLKGEYRFEEALAALLTDTGLEYKFTAENQVVIQEREQDEETESRADEEVPVEDEEMPLELGKQTVTGSRLPRTPRQVSAQVITISNADLRNTGSPTLERALRQLPQNINGTTEFGGAGLYRYPDESGRLLGTSNVNGSSTVNLRGLGESATLILIDGKRVGDSGMLGGFTDISEIPISIVERIEIQMDGASSVYGSDAIGGVVNVILKKDYDALRASVRRTARTRGGLTEYNASVTGSTAWNTGNASLSLDAYDATPQDVSRTEINLLGTDETGYPGNVRGRGGSFIFPNEISRALTQAALDAGRIAPGETVKVVPIPESQDGTSLTLNDFLAAVNMPRTNAGIVEPIAITPSSERYQFRFYANQEVADWLAIGGGLTYAKRETSSNSGLAVGRIAFWVAAENPYNPFGTAVDVDMTLADFGTKVVTGDRESLTLDLDLNGAVSANWSWELRSRFADRASTAKTFNVVNRAILNDLVNFTRTAPSNALNVFGTSFMTDGQNADVLAGSGFHIPLEQSDTTNRLASSELVIRGDLFSLPAGQLRMVAGAEWRKTSLDVDYGTTFLQVITEASPIPRNVLSQGFAQKGTRTLRAGFAELFVPIISSSNTILGVHDLNATLSGRHEKADGSSNAGSETSSSYQSNVWSAGLVFRPVENIKLRVSKSTSYRVPDIANSLFPPLIQRGLIFDFREGRRAIAWVDKTTGGNPTLRPEESTSVTAGIQFAPVLLAGLTLDVDYHETNFHNRIAAINFAGSSFVSDQIFQRFGFQYILDDEGNITAVDSRRTNIARVDTQGMDYRMAYDYEGDTNSFGLSMNIAATRTMREDINTYDPVPAKELVGPTIPKYRYQASFYWARAGWRLVFNGRSSSSLHYETRQRLELGGNLEKIQVKRDPPTVVDFRATLDINEAWSSAPPLLTSVRLNLGINNIFGSVGKTILNPEPDQGLIGIPEGMNSARGRMYYLEISKDF